MNQARWGILLRLLAGLFGDRTGAGGVMAAYREACERFPEMPRVEPAPALAAE